MSTSAEQQRCILFGHQTPALLSVGTFLIGWLHVTQISYCELFGTGSSGVRGSKETRVLWPYCQKDCGQPAEGNHGRESAWKKSTGKTKNSLAGKS